jgi:hypothetical protein
MTLPFKRKYLSISILAVIIPVSLLTAFKITGIIPEPPTIVETIEMETVTLGFDRPFKDVKAPAIANGYVDENVLINVSMPSVEYCDQFSGDPSNGRDILFTSVWINATAFQGFVHSVEFSCEVDEISWICWIYDFHRDKFYNATLVEKKETINWIRLNFRVSSSPAAIYIPLDWIFFEGDGSVEHQLSLSVRTIYYNGTAYREVVIPLRIEVTRDIGNTFEEARVLEPSNILGSLDVGDRIDMYALTLQKGQTISITLIPPKDSDFNIYLYNQNREELANSTQRGNQVETITYTINETGTYYMKVEFVDWPGHKCEGIYQLKIEVLKVK